MGIFIMGPVWDFLGVPRDDLQVNAASEYYFKGERFYWAARSSRSRAPVSDPTI